MTPVLIGMGANTKRPHVDSSELGKTADDGASDSMTVSFIEASGEQSDAESEQANDWLAANPPLKSVPLSAPAPTYNLPPADDDTDSAHVGPAGSNPSVPGRRLLYGRYIGQITARIERAWMRPRTPIDDVAFFACRVRVTQDQRGIVQEIELVRCNGTPRWQTSVVQAIQSASPLPAPPDADVYTSQITLDLQSATFTPGASAEGFEPGASVAVGRQVIGR